MCVCVCVDIVRGKQHTQPAQMIELKYHFLFTYFTNNILLYYLFLYSSMCKKINLIN